MAQTQFGPEISKTGTMVATQKNIRKKLFARRRTTAFAIKRRERMKAALDFRRTGHDYQSIAKEMRAPVSTVQSWVAAAIAELIPVETLEAVRTLEIARLDALYSAYFQNAVDGTDIPAAEMCLRIHAARCKLLGLHPQQQSAGAFNVAIGGPEHEHPGINVVFRFPPQVKDDTGEDAPVLSHQPVQPLALPGPKKW
jgi:hypothetical protein